MLEQTSVFRGTLPPPTAEFLAWSDCRVGRRMSERALAIYQSLPRHHGAVVDWQYLGSSSERDQLRAAFVTWCQARPKSDWPMWVRAALKRDGIEVMP